MVVPANPGSVMELDPDGENVRFLIPNILRRL
jgi:hypothetical protein